MPLQPLSPPTPQFLAQSTHKLLIGGEWVAAASDETFTSINPSDGTTLAQLASAGAADVDRAVSAARRAFEAGWGDMPPAQRETLLRRLGDLITAHADELAEVECLDNGKPIHHTRSIDSRVAARQVYHFAGWPSKIAGRTPAVSIPGHFVYTRREPLGVAAIIIRWNYSLIHRLLTK